MTESDDEHRVKRKKKKHHKHRHRERDGREEREPREPREAAFCTPELKMKMMDLIQSIMRKDVHMIFAEPVTDLIAPGYSTYISDPMDLSTMQVKVQRGEYTALKQLKSDADMMCRNCMVYNSPDTIFYKEALKIQSYINTLFGEKRGVLKEAMKEVDDAIKKKNRIQEELIAVEVEEQVSRAAKIARHKLNKLRPDTRVGFLSEVDGYTLMNILNAPKGEPTEKVVDLSSIKKKEVTNTCLLNSMKEKKRVPGKEVQYLNYGPYGSFAPVYDSTFSNLDPEDQQLLYKSYGDDLGLTYCRSVQDFTKGASEDVRNKVEKGLVHLTGGGHTKASKLLAVTHMALRDKKAKRAALAERNMHSFMNFLESEDIPNFNFREPDEPILLDQPENKDTPQPATAPQPFPAESKEQSWAESTSSLEVPPTTTVEPTRPMIFPPFMD